MLKFLRPLNNWDENRLGQEQPDFPHLLFESRFESGNLRRAIQVHTIHFIYMYCQVHLFLVVHTFKSAKKN
jgi:hypothetical protein